MDLKLRRADRGMSVFWMILILGAGVFLLLTIVLLAGREAGEDLAGDGAGVPVDSAGVEETDATAPIVVGEPDPDTTYNTDDVTVRTGEDADGPDGTTEQAFSEREEGIEVEPAGVEAVGPGTDPASNEAPVEGDEAGDGEVVLIDDAEQERLEGGGDGVTVDDLDQSDIVVDPDGTTAPVVPTPSGPEGEDDDPFTAE
ncbi:hypothetical protein [Hasllibacter halocynthiae]|nr:hypothetical protein [Hasllibacter halocynthiae]